MTRCDGSRFTWTLTRAVKWPLKLRATLKFLMHWTIFMIRRRSVLPIAKNLLHGIGFKMEVSMRFQIYGDNRRGWHSFGKLYWKFEYFRWDRIFDSAWKLCICVILTFSNFSRKLCRMVGNVNTKFGVHFAFT